MFKLVVLSALVAVAVAAPRPGVFAAAPLAYSAPVVHSAVVGVSPSAVSHQSRVDIVSKPVVHTTYTAPAVVHAAPVVHAVPAVHSVAYSAPVHSVAYGAPVHSLAYNSAPVYGHHGLVAAHHGGYGVVGPVVAY